MRQASSFNVQSSGNKSGYSELSKLKSDFNGDFLDVIALKF